MGSNHLEYRDKVYDLLLKGNKTSTELARLIRCDSRVVSEQLRRLKKQGKVKIVGDIHSTPLWTAVKNPKPVVADGFKSKPVDKFKLRKSLKGTPWQGMESLI